ncbi:unnamed protein product [Symbiodinium sp. CCMP2456]|nr:unnamed protein product [Symbiodinium sp. CCMP2456]
MLILALDYANSKQRLPSVNDAKHMEADDGSLFQPSVSRERSDGLKWLARCLFPQARGKSNYQTRVNIDSAADSMEAWDLPTLPAGGTAGQQVHEAASQPTRAEKPSIRSPSAAQPADADISRRRQTVDQALAEQGSQPQQLPAELLDELVPASSVGELLPPLPANGHQRQTPEQVVENEAPEGKRLEDNLVLRERPASFRRGLTSTSSSRPTTAGEESAATQGSRISGKSSWRSQWTPGQAETGDVVSSTTSFEMRHQPPPPPQSDHRTLSGQSATAFDDPEFLVALKRASESDNARFAAPPALGQRKWGKPAAGHDEAAASAATASCADLSWYCDFMQRCWIALCWQNLMGKTEQWSSLGCCTCFQQVQQRTRTASNSFAFVPLQSAKQRTNYGHNPVEVGLSQIVQL